MLKKDEQFVEEMMQKWRNISLSNINDTCNMMPLTIRVATSTIAMNLVPVIPMSIPNADNSQIINEVKSINRERKINSIVEGTEFSIMKAEEHPKYIKGNLFYMDISYTTGI